MTDRRNITTLDDAPGQWRTELPEQVSELLSEALAVDATDIHVDPVGFNAYRICFRVDGVIQPKPEVSKDEGQHLVNQIKVAATASGIAAERAFSRWLRWTVRWPARFPGAMEPTPCAP